MGFFFGIFAVLGSIVLLTWNEGRAVTTEKSLKEGAAAVISVASDTIAPGNDKKLIYLTGDVAAGDVIHDPLFNLSATALRLTRHAEMYQWKQEEHHDTHNKLGGGQETVTTYTYSKEWSDKPVNSSTFKHPEDHTNPTSFPVQAATTLSAKATLGAFKIPPPIIAKMQGDAPLAAGADVLAPLSPALKAKAKVTDDGIYIGGDPATPAVGDVRVSFLVLNPGTFSILAQQNGDTLAPYPAKAGREIERVESGTVSAESMFQHAESENRLITWLVRLGGFILMFIGFAAILNPLKVLADVIPFVGSIIGFGTGLIAGMLAFAGSLVVIAIAWLFVRPLLGGTLLVIALAAVIHGFIRVRQHHLAATAAAPR